MFELRVLNGLHEGAALPLSGEGWWVGNSGDSDLQLCDSGIKALHAQLLHSADHWTLLPQQGEICQHNGEILTTEQHWQPGECYAFSGVWIMLAESGMPWPSQLPDTLAPQVTEPVQDEPDMPHQPETPLVAASWRSRLFPRWIQIFSISSLLLLSFTVISWVLQPGMAQSINEEQIMRKPLLTDGTALRSVLMRKLQERDLAQQVQITGNNNGITLRGELNHKQLAIVSRLVDMLHHHYQLDVPLNNQTRLRQVSLPFRIVQITAGEHANIVTDHGQRLFVGDERDGLQLSAITADSVQFSGREQITVKW